MNEINSDQSKLFYIASIKEIVRVKIHLLACVADLPERCDVCCISRGNSTHTTRFGYISEKNVLQQSLQSCETCLEKRIRNVENKIYVQEDTVCNLCLDWCFDKNDNLSQYNLPKNYPDISGTSFLCTKRVNFDELKNACIFAKEQLVSKN